MLFKDANRADRVQNLVGGIISRVSTGIKKESCAMTTDFSRESAKIIEFPAGGRRAVAVRRDESNLAADPAALRVSGDAFGSGWYHEAAIQESKRTGGR
jgi:hypothetical protein